MQTATSFTGSVGTISSGRQTGQFTAGSRTVHFVLWFSNTQNAVLMTTDSNLLETGLVRLQSATTIGSGNYALHYSGATFSGPLALEGQLLADGSSVFTGLEDFNVGGALASGATASGNYSFGSNGRGTGTIGGTPVALYPVDANTTYLLAIDGTVVTGMLEAQH